ncbi:MAG: MarR family transcriptional regulator [Candidatus Eremiobacteraeota bacterium]|nr:MarR family transcriptional regulator [Candidatus Eremiobacteraeota bacterium]
MSDVLAALGATVRALRATLDRELRSQGLRLGQYQVLRVLWESDGLTPRDLAGRLAVEMPTVTRTVQRMFRDGLVRREDHPSDARSVNIFLTDRGREVRAPIERLLDDHMSRVLAGFTDRDRQSIVGYLERILANARIL